MSYVLISNTILPFKNSKVAESLGLLCLFCLHLHSALIGMMDRLWKRSRAQKGKKYWSNSATTRPNKREHTVFLCTGWSCSEGRLDKPPACLHCTTWPSLHLHHPNRGLENQWFQFHFGLGNKKSLFKQSNDFINTNNGTVVAMSPQLFS